MTPAARLQSTLEAIDTIMASRVPMDLTLGDFFRPRRYIGAKDRGAIAERVYTIIRHFARLRWHLEAWGEPITGRSLTIASLCLIDRTSPAPFFDGAVHHPAPLVRQELDLIAALAETILMPDAMDQATRTECPPDYAAILQELYGDRFVEEMEAMIKGAALDIRVNTHGAARDVVQASLAKDGVTTTPTPFAPAGLRVVGKTYLARTKAFVKGWIDIQDEGSQIIAHLCNARPGQQILDYCAGGGGKTLALASAMSTGQTLKGRIVAMDIDAGRLMKARIRFRRAHVHDIIEPRPLSDERHRKWLRRQKGTFDAVLVDVPCSGSGTWRRNPDLRWRRLGPDRTELAATQRDILSRVADAPKSGGRLVYATCSLLPEENEDVITDFLKTRPDYTLAPIAECWPAGTPCPVTGSFLRLTPSAHQTDGFFAAVMIRS